MPTYIKIEPLDINFQEMLADSKNGQLLPRPPTSHPHPPLIYFVKNRPKIYTFPS